MRIVTGPGDLRIARDLYQTAVLSAVERMQREGVYVCMDNIMKRMLSYNQKILWDVLWELACEGRLA